MPTETPNSSHAPNVTSLHGAQIATGEPNAGCVTKLRELLAQAEAGEITGIACAALHGDNTASYSIAGLVGPYSLLGATEMAQVELTDLMKVMR